ncbi:hypothetical protein [Actinoplanes siamensis]
MTTTAHRTPVLGLSALGLSALRSLPALLALVLAFFAAPATAAAPDAHGGPVSAAVAVSSASASSAAASAAAPVSSAPAAVVSAEVTAPLAEPVSGRPVTDRTRVLSAQRSAGVAGSRAPPRTAA